jgi:hypothetical protein
MLITMHNAHRMPLFMPPGVVLCFNRVWMTRLPSGEPIRVTRVESAEGGRRTLPSERNCYHVLLEEILKSHCPNSNL